MEKVQEVLKFLEDSKVFYVATVLMGTNLV